MTEVLANIGRVPDLTLWDRIMSTCDPETHSAKVILDAEGRNRYVREWAAFGTSPSGDGMSFMSVVQTDAPSKPGVGKHRPENLPTLRLHLEQSFGHEDWGNFLIYRHVGVLTGSNLVELDVTLETQHGTTREREKLEPAAALAQTSITLQESSWNAC